MNNFYLHGFLSHADSLTKLPLKNHFEGIDLLSLVTQSHNKKKFLTLLRDQIKSADVLLGYSLGGRIALELLALDPKLAKKLILVSSHFGGIENAHQRIQEDLQWATKLETLPPQDFLKLWQQQGLFTTDAPLGFFNVQVEQSFFLKEFSLGKQENLIHIARTLPTLYLYGQEDIKFSQYQRDLNLNSVQIEEASHRCLWDRPNICAQYIDSFIQQEIP